MCTQVHMCTYIGTHVCIHNHAQAHMTLYRCTRAHACSHRHTETHTCTHRHTCVHTGARTHTHTSCPSGLCGTLTAAGIGGQPVRLPGAEGALMGGQGWECGRGPPGISTRPAQADISSHAGPGERTTAEQGQGRVEDRLGGRSGGHGSRFLGRGGAGAGGQG